VKRAAALLALAGALALPSLAFAHEMRPAFLRIRESAPETYEVLWKVPAKERSLRLSLHLRFDDDVEVLAPPVAGFSDRAHVQRMRIQRAGGLTGSRVAVEGLERTLTDVLLQVERLDGTTFTHRIRPDAPSAVIEAAPGPGQVAWTYAVLGVEHILLGIDHLLFVLALLLIVTDLRKLVGTITAFTAAHSVTLALSALGHVSLPGPPVEAVIALSVVFVAAEIVRGQQGNPGLTARAPWTVAFAFGLLHGFGFAGALSEIGLPQASVPLALVSFNVGVEVGQLLFVAALLLVYGVARKLGKEPSPGLRRAPAYLIGGVAAFWLIERVAGFWA
jgi:hydrogenase/urease accessory protein HupE